MYVYDFDRYETVQIAGAKGCFLGIQKKGEGVTYIAPPVSTQ